MFVLVCNTHRSFVSPVLIVAIKGPLSR